MLERLLELLLHAKSGVFAGALLLGTTGALVSASVATAGNVTTITLTQASASPSANVEQTNRIASPKASPTAEPTESPSSSPVTPAARTTVTTVTAECTAQLTAAKDALKTVQTAFATDRSALANLESGVKTADQRKTLKDAMNLLESIRESAKNAIHATTAACATAKDETDEKDADNNDVNDENDDADEQGDNDGDHEHDSSTTPAVTTPTTAATPKPSPSNAVTFTSADPKAIADQAVAAMTVVVNTTKAALPAVTTTPKPAKSPELEHADKSKKSAKQDGNGEHHD